LSFSTFTDDDGDDAMVSSLPLSHYFCSSPVPPPSLFGLLILSLVRKGRGRRMFASVRMSRTAEHLCS